MNVPYFAMLAPILSIVILTLGNGLFTTYTTLQLHNLQASTVVIGVISSGYFLGVMIGSIWAQRLVMRTGYVRAFATFASLMAVCALLQGLFNYPWLWGILRFICGYCLAGLFIVIESWLLAFGNRQTKGRIMAFYLFSYYLAMTVSQLLLDLPYDSVLAAFAMIACLSALAVIPVCVIKCEAPEQGVPQLISLSRLLSQAPLGAGAALVSGMTLGIIYTVVPLFLVNIAESTERIAWVMAAIVLGGTLLQLPIGKLSDKFDRRKMIAIVNAATVVTAVLIMIYYAIWPLLLLLAFMLGGFTFTLYPLAINHTTDDLATNETISAMAMITLIYGVGSAVGPILATSAMHYFGVTGVFLVLTVIAAALTIYSAWRIAKQKSRITSKHHEFMPASPETTLVVNDQNDREGR